MLNTVSNMFLNPKFVILYMMEKSEEKNFSQYGPLKNGAGSQLVSLSVIKIWISLIAVLNHKWIGEKWPLKKRSRFSMVSISVIKTWVSLFYCFKWIGGRAYAKQRNSI
jgi:hypothetical protein